MVALCYDRIHSLNVVANIYLKLPSSSAETILPIFSKTTRNIGKQKFHKLIKTALELISWQRRVS